MQTTLLRIYSVQGEELWLYQVLPCTYVLLKTTISFADHDLDACHKPKCNLMVASHDTKLARYCAIHKCVYCSDSASHDRGFCNKHECVVQSCARGRATRASVYCQDHECRVRSCRAEATVAGGACRVNQHDLHNVGVAEMQG